MKSAAIMCVAAAVLVVGLSITCAMRAVPKKPGKVYGPSKMLQKPEPQSEYDRLLAKYLANVDNLAKQHQELARSNWRERADYYSQAAHRVHLDESKTYEQLHSASLHRPLTFDGEVEENIAFVPSSTVSAKVFRKLHDEGIVRSDNMVRKLANSTDLLSPEWVPLLQDIADHSQVGSLPWSSSRFSLYKMGVERKKYRADLERMVLDGPSPSALRALLFEVDKETGEAKPVKTPENSALFDKISSTANAFPEVMEVCAEYAADIGDIAQAERICFDLLSQQYTLRDSDKERGPDHRDYQLARARTSAMYLMFYKLKTPRCFKAIYDLSRTRENDAIRDQRQSTGWVSLAASGLGRMDIQEAQSLVGQASEYQ